MNSSSQPSLGTSPFNSVFSSSQCNNGIGQLRVWHRLAGVSVLAVATMWTSAWAQTESAATKVLVDVSQETKDYTPTRGQAGKDVIWIATPDAHVDRMLQLAGANTNDVVMDLGSGDGKIVLAAAKMGMRGHGVEYNPDLVALSQRLARESGLQDRATFEKADLFDVDLTKASIITMYLLPELNLKLRPKLFTLQPGTRIVSHDFRMGKWQPDETSQVGVNKMHLWVIPANAGGMWQGQFKTPRGLQDIRIHSTQTFQQVQGQAMFDGVTTSLREVALLGTQWRWAFTDREGKLRRFVGSIQGDGVSGHIDGEPFHAQRVGQAPVIEGSGPVPPEDMEYIQ